MFKAWDDKKFAQTIDYIEQEKEYKVIVTASPDKKELQKTQNLQIRNLKEGDYVRPI